MINELLKWPGLAGKGPAKQDDASCNKILHCCFDESGQLAGCKSQTDLLMDRAISVCLCCITSTFASKLNAM